MELMIIEDDPINLKLLKLLTMNLGYDISEAENGVEALEKTKKMTPELILCDIHLPLLNGFEFLNTFREQEKKKTSFYAVTSMTMPGDKEYILTRGFDGYISKPIDTRYLRKFLIEFKEQHSKFN